MWEIEFTPESINYLVESGEYGEKLLDAIDRLADAPEGIATEGTYPANDLSEEILVWEVLGHYVYYQIFTQESIIRIEAIKTVD